jgi:hypothetical protein
MTDQTVLQVIDFYCNMCLKFITLCFTLIYVLTPVFASVDYEQVHNANHLFNSIHSSMRQWGSSLNHNGMTVFLATVPADTQLYHGTYKGMAIQGMEWPAFEPEHAFIFAQPRWDPPPPEGHKPPRKDEHFEAWYAHYGPSDAIEQSKRHQKEQSRRHELAYNHDTDAEYFERVQSQRNRPHSQPRLAKQQGSPKIGRKTRILHSEQQQPLVAPKSETPTRVGHLHTYTAKHDLRLLYVDGLSAGKTRNGTLDTQDMLILESTPPPEGPILGDYARAQAMCNLTSTIWGGRIDGILRMEGGFEVILCDFERHLDLTDAMGVPLHQGDRGFLGTWAYIKAITTRFYGIGGERVRLDYENFVSVFAYAGIDGLFTNDVQSDYTMPRLQNVAVADRMRVRADITDMILRDEKKVSRNWQAIADMTVARYSHPLHYLHTDKRIRVDRTAFAEYLKLLLVPFIAYTARNTTLETRRCVAQVISLQAPASLAHRTVRSITHRICSTLLEALAVVSLDESSPYTREDASNAIRLIDDPIEYLQWTAWKDCGACPDEQICYIPIWPMGNHEDHKQPRCRTSDEARSRCGYWGGGDTGARRRDSPDEGEHREAFGLWPKSDVLP